MTVDDILIYVQKLWSSQLSLNNLWFIVDNYENDKSHNYDHDESPDYDHNESPDYDKI